MNYIPSIASYSVTIPRALWNELAGEGAENTDPSNPSFEPNEDLIGCLTDNELANLQAALKRALRTISQQGGNRPREFQVDVTEDEAQVLHYTAVLYYRQRLAYLEKHPMSRITKSRIQQTLAMIEPLGAVLGKSPLHDGTTR